MSETVPVTPRLSATVLLVRDDPFEVLMVRRHAEAHFASALVFPGGTIDAEDRSEVWFDHITGAEELDEEARTLRVAACRELSRDAATCYFGPPSRAAVVAAAYKSRGCRADTCPCLGG